MKFKEIIRTKAFIAGSLSVVCVGILAACIFIGREKPAEFKPEPPTSSAPISTWEENATGNAGLADGDSDGQKAQGDEYPKQVETSDDEVVIDFTDPEPEKPEAPKAPEGSENPTNPEHPTYSKEDVPKPESKPKPESQPKPESSGPQPGDRNEQGQVYDRAFGWVTPSDVKQEVIDGDGDPNKMVGTMD